MSDWRKLDRLWGHKHYDWPDERVLERVLAAGAVLNSRGAILCKEHGSNTYELRRQIYAYLERCGIDVEQPDETETMNADIPFWKDE